MKIAIYGSRRQEEHFGLVGEFLTELGSLGCEVVMHRKLYSHLYGAIPGALAAVRRVVDGPAFAADYAVSLGGDGTFLRTAMWVADKEIPVVGVNTGHLGYLAAIPVERLVPLARVLAAGAPGFRLEKRGLIKASVDGMELRTWPYALNEVAVAKEENSSMISAEVAVDGHPLAVYRADGLLVCTSTGSTAYNLSIGGPIVQPTLDVRVLAPIAAHSLSMRPLVVSAASEIVVVPKARAASVRLSFDGRSMSLPVGTPVRLSSAPFATYVMQLEEHSFADTLREKLHWAAEND